MIILKGTQQKNIDTGDNFLAMKYSIYRAQRQHSLGKKELNHIRAHTRYFFTLFSSLTPWTADWLRRMFTKSQRDGGGG